MIRDCFQKGDEGATGLLAARPKMQELAFGDSVDPNRHRALASVIKFSWNLGFSTLKRLANQIVVMSTRQRVFAIIIC